MSKILLDFGYVLCYPTTGEWLISPWFAQYIRDHGYDRKAIIKSFKGNKDILDRTVYTLENEEEMFVDFFTKSLSKTDYDFTDADIRQIANELTYSTDKYRTFKGVKEELEELSKHNRLYMLSDNWPCGKRMMDHWDLSQYFDDIYISSQYGIKKDEKAFFQKPIYDYNLDKSNIVFVDDADYCLDTAASMGISSFRMDRYPDKHKVYKSREYPVINNLLELKKHI